MHIYSSKYESYVKDVFVEHHDCMGMDLEEAEDLFNEYRGKVANTYWL